MNVNVIVDIMKGIMRYWIFILGAQDELKTQSDELQQRDAVVQQRNQELADVNGQLKDLQGMFDEYENYREMGNVSDDPPNS